MPHTTTKSRAHGIRALLPALVAGLLLGAAPAAPAAETMVAPGETIASGSHRSSANGQYHLAMQTDGNLVLYTGGRALWSSRTAGHGGARAVMQDDGNFVVYSTSDRALFATGTPGRPGAKLAIQDDANLVVYTSAGTPAWSSQTVNDRLLPGETLKAGQYLMSRNRQYRLIQQGDGNFVLYQGSRALWANGTVNRPGARTVMQHDGNLVTYTPANAALWNTNTQGRSGAFLVVQDDANVVIYHNGTAPWSTRTAVTSSVTEQAAAAAEARIGQVYTTENRNATWWSGWCETFVEVAYGNRFRKSSANAHYYDRLAANQVRTGVPPRGAIVFYGGGGGYGHVAIAVGNGAIVSTQGHIDNRYPVARFSSYLAFPEYRGWATPY